MTHRRPSLTTTNDLLAAGLVPSERAGELQEVERQFAVRIPAELVERLAGRQADQRLARQFVPDPHELVTAPEELADPIGDRSHSPLTGLVHRYPDRVLLQPLFACAVYCRFCFRREVVGPGMAPLDAAELEAALDYIRSRPAIWEVILSGGDPLLLSARRLGAIVAALDAMAHVGVVRLHTRVPVVEPERLTPALVGALSTSQAAVYVAVHCNHPDELTPAAVAACRRLAMAGIPLLGQSVLLRGVNDDEETLTALMRAMVRARIKPYYLHHPDLARGTGHFRTTIAAGQSLVRSLRGRLSGLCQPTYVLDLPGGHGKVPVGPGYVEPQGDGRYLVEDWQGRRHAYPPVPGDEAV